MSDPVADFLAREQNMFADFDGAPPAEAPAVAAPVGDDFGDLQAAVADVPAHTDSGVDLSAFAEDAPVVDIPAVVAPQPEEPLVNGNHGSIASRGSSKGPSPVLSTVPKIEAENIRLWKEQQKKILEEKDALEEKKKEELRANAKKELEDWYKQREKTLSLIHEENLKNEKANQEMFVKQQDGEAQWETVNKLIDQQKTKSGKDLGRLKTLLAGLKHMNVSK
ncbi:unnamed protein product [Caenorhabditis bovis]|uniref:Clathrin light chain n=1 Tax=Caenorhabditis bovis TaxID=2654633 RepID=A0A8S1EDG5_9PELO|nr:unnamed protein product [Caenorhabditis bovis]